MVRDVIEVGQELELDCGMHTVEVLHPVVHLTEIYPQMTDVVGVRAASYLIVSMQGHDSYFK